MFCSHGAGGMFVHVYTHRWHVLFAFLTGCRSAHCGMFFSVVIVALCDERIGGARSEIIVRITAAEWISAVVEICGVDFAVDGLSCTG